MCSILLPSLIFDDGLCFGESLMQMIDEVASLKVLTITLISVIGRLNNHKRFPPLNSINEMF